MSQHAHNLSHALSAVDQYAAEALRLRLRRNAAEPARRGFYTGLIAEAERKIDALLFGAEVEHVLMDEMEDNEWRCAS